MPAITGCTIAQIEPNPNYRIEVITTPATADSNDTLDVSSAAATGGNTFKTIYGIIGAFDTSQDYDAVTATWSTTTITIDAAGGKTNTVYKIIVMGV